MLDFYKEYSMTNYVKPHIRWLLDRDYASVLEIDSDCFIENWDKNRLVATLKQRNFIGMAAELNGIISGYIVYQLHPDCIEVNRLAVHSAFRNRGVGSALILRLKQRLVNTKTNTRTAIRNRAMVTLSEWNDDSHHWLKNRGFIATDVVKANGQVYYTFEYWYDEADLKPSSSEICVEQL